MGYKYREVSCPICKRKFMWGSDPNEYKYYRIRGTNEWAGQAKCPTCNRYLAVINGKLDGVMPNEREELIPISWE